MNAQIRKEIDNLTKRLKDFDAGEVMSVLNTVLVRWAQDHGWDPVGMAQHILTGTIMAKHDIQHMEINDFKEEGEIDLGDLDIY